MILKISSRTSSVDGIVFSSPSRITTVVGACRIESFSTDKEGVLVNELYDEANNQYLYRIINMTEIRCEEMQGVRQTTKVNFDKKFKKADVFENGQWKTVELNDGEFEKIAASAVTAAYERTLELQKKQT